MSQQLVIGASYPARRSSGIAVKESTKGALMVHIPFKLTGDLAFEAIHSVCIGTKDGTLQEHAIENLHRIFPAWDSQNPFDLQRLEIPEGSDAEFMLVNYHNEPYTPEGKTEQVDRFVFQWINELGRGAVQASDDEEKATLAKWGVKFGLGKSAAAGKPTKKTEPEPDSAPTTRKAPGKKSAAAPRKSNAGEVWALLLKKHGVKTVKDNDGDIVADPETPESVTDPIQEEYFNAQDELFGKGAEVTTDEQWGQVADRLGV